MPSAAAPAPALLLRTERHAHRRGNVWLATIDTVIERLFQKHTWGCLILSRSCLRSSHPALFFRVNANTPDIHTYVPIHSQANTSTNRETERERVRETNRSGERGEQHFAALVVSYNSSHTPIFLPTQSHTFFFSFSLFLSLLFYLYSFLSIFIPHIVTRFHCTTFFSLSITTMLPTLRFRASSLWLLSYSFFSFPFILSIDFLIACVHISVFLFPRRITSSLSDYFLPFLPIGYPHASTRTCTPLSTYSHYFESLQTYFFDVQQSEAMIANWAISVQWKIFFYENIFSSSLGLTNY